VKITIKVKTDAKQDKIEEKEGIFSVCVKERAEKGKANKKLIEILSKYFNVPKQNIEIITGKTSRNKIVEIYQK